MNTDVPHHLPGAAGPQHSAALWGWCNGRTVAPGNPPRPWASISPAVPKPVWPPEVDPS